MSNFKGIEYKELLIFPIVSSDQGEELGIIKNGNLSILKDINLGPISSNPNNFVHYKDKAYFSAIESNNISGIWPTDGTTENTKPSISFISNSGSKPNGLIVSRSGWLYYTVNDTLFRFNGVRNETIYAKVTFEKQVRHQSNNYCLYKNEVAFIVEENDLINLYKTESDSVILLSSTNLTSGFANIYGLAETSQGLIFGVEDPFREKITGIYSFNEESKALNKISVGGSYASRLHQFTEKLSLAWVAGKGYYVIDGIQGNEVLLFPSSNTVFTQGEEIVHGISNNKIIFHAFDGFFKDSYLVLSNGTSSETTKLFIVIQYLSNIIVHENFAFITSGTSNGFYPELYRVNLNNGAFDNILNFNQPSLINSLLLLRVQNNKLFFISDLDTSLGFELFSMNLETSTKVKTINEEDFNVIKTNNNYQVISDKISSLNVSIYTIDGKILNLDTIKTNTQYSLPNSNGIFLMVFQTANTIKVEKIIVSN